MFDILWYFFIFNNSALPYTISQGCQIAYPLRSTAQRGEISVSSALLEKLPKQSELFCVLESVVEVPGGHIRHSSCALKSWYDPIGQSLHFPVALSK